MDFKSVKEDWDQLAKKDALWAILTSPDKSGNKWDEEAFFDSGRLEIDRLFHFLESRQLSPSNYAVALDFGCGVGRLSRALGQRFSKVYGLDVSEQMIQKSRQMNALFLDKLEFVLNTEPRLPFEKDSISFIYSSIVLQHIPQLQKRKYIAECCRVLQEGGLLVFQVPTADIRKLSFWQKIRSKLKIRERLTRMGLGNYYPMQMNSLPYSSVETILKEEGCRILAHAYTNHTDPAFEGKLQFLDRTGCIDYESSLFVVGKRV